MTKCEGCKVRFEPARKDQRFHDDKCRVNAWRRENRGQGTQRPVNPTKQRCQQCKQWYQPKYKTGKYCSTECRMSAAYQRRKAQGKSK